MKNLNNLKVGQIIYGKEVSIFNGKAWIYVYEILNMDPPSLRFNKIDRLLTVKVTTSHGTVIDQSIKRWFSQLF